MLRAVAVILTIQLHAMSARGQEPPLPIGVVVGVGAVDFSAAMQAARSAAGASWRGTRIVPRRAVPASPPAAVLEQLRRLYLEADFLGCLTRMQSPELAVDALLAQGQRELAGLTVVLGAACAFDAGDAELARDLLGRAIACDLPTRALREVKPGVQALMETLQAEAVQRPRLRLRLRSQPTGARVTIDGAVPSTCTHTPCSLTLRHGPHVLLLERLGYLPRTVILRLERSTERQVALDPAPSALAREQLAVALAAGLAADSASFAETASHAEQARVVVIVELGRDARASATLYDRALGRIVARSRGAEPADGAATVVRAVIGEWRGQVEVRPLWKRPLFWGITAATAAAAALTAFLLARPTEQRFALEFAEAQ